MCFSGLQRRRRENFGVLNSLNGISTCFLKEIIDFFTFGHQNFYIRSKILHSEGKISGLNVKNLPSECKQINTACQYRALNIAPETPQVKDNYQGANSNLA